MSVIEDYLEQLDARQKEALSRLCRIAREAIPDAEEALSYGMPAFKYRQRPVLGFTASKKHLSLHPFSPGVIEAVKGELGGFALSKGTIRFTPEQPLPEEVVQAIIAARLKEIIAAGA